MDDYHRLSQSRLLQVLSAHIAAVYCSCVTVCVCVCFGLRLGAFGDKAMVSE